MKKNTNDTYTASFALPADAFSKIVAYAKTTHQSPDHVVQEAVLSFLRLPQIEGFNAGLSKRSGDLVTKLDVGFKYSRRQLAAAWGTYEANAQPLIMNLVGRGLLESSYSGPPERPRVCNVYSLTTAGEAHKKEFEMSPSLREQTRWYKANQETLSQRIEAGALYDIVQEYTTSHYRTKIGAWFLSQRGVQKERILSALQVLPVEPTPEEWDKITQWQFDGPFDTPVTREMLEADRAKLPFQRDDCGLFSDHYDEAVEMRAKEAVIAWGARYKAKSVPPTEQTKASEYDTEF